MPRRRRPAAARSTPTSSRCLRLWRSRRDVDDSLRRPARGARRPRERVLREHAPHQRLARAQADDALLHEGIDNALKLFGDSYLVRVYGIAAARFRFDDYDATIQRKRTVLERIYERLADQATTRRSEFLEWIIILLIAGEIVMALA